MGAVSSTNKLITRLSLVPLVELYLFPESIKMLFFTRLVFIVKESPPFERQTSQGHSNKPINYSMFAL